MMKKIIILASGSGTNAENIIRYFQNSSEVEVHSVLCNKKEAGVYQRAKRLQIPCHWLDTTSSNSLLTYCKAQAPDLIVLSGYLKKIPSELIHQFENKIINIHPALLPKYGGKGMFGMNVHKAVKAAGEKVSGITIHYVNAQYDEGEVIFQAQTNLQPEDQPYEIAKKVQNLEYEYFPKVIENLLK